MSNLIGWLFSSLSLEGFRGPVKIAADVNIHGKAKIGPPLLSRIPRALAFSLAIYAWRILNGILKLKRENSGTVCMDVLVKLITGLQRR